MPALQINTIFVSQHVNQKINQQHHVTALEVEEACDGPIEARWAENDEGVERLLLIGETDAGRRLRVVLYPTQLDGEWSLGSAFPVQ